MKKPIMKKENLKSYVEENGMMILKTKLESTKRLKAYFNQNDKTPIFDGYFNFLDDEQHILKKIEVQIKSHEKIRIITKGKNKNKFKYEFDTAVLNAIRYKITNNPTIYFVIDCECARCYFKLIDKEFLVNLHYDISKTKTTYYFNKNDVIEDIDKFVDYIGKIYVETLDNSNFKSIEEIKAIQIAMNDFYSKLNDLSFIKDAIWPNLWKFGIRCSNDIKFDFVNSKAGEKIGSNPNVFAIFPIQLGSEEKEIRDYMPNNENLFTHFDFIGEQTLEGYLNDCLSKILNIYFDGELSIKIMPNICLDELIFSILDEMSKTNNKLSGASFNECKYNEISIDELSNIFEPYLKAKNYIIQKNIDEIIEPFITNFFFNPFLNYNNFRLICLAEELIDECKRRNKITINRVWDYFVSKEKAKLVRYKDELFDQEKIQLSVQKLFNLLVDCTDEVIDYLPIKIKNPICQNYIYDFYFDYNSPMPSYVISMAMVAEGCKPCFTRSSITKCNYKWKSYSIFFTDLFMSRTPLFNLLRVVIHFAICKKYNVRYDSNVVEKSNFSYPFFKN